MTDALPPLPWRWDGEALVPQNAHWARRADALLVVGQTYVMEERQERSSKAHAHFFASVSELWQSLPEHLSAQMPTAEHARKRALVQTGYHNRRDVACATKAEAQRIAALVPSLDEYAVAIVEGNVVTILRPKSQDYRSMDRATFAASKDAVLGYLSDLVGVTPSDLSSASRRAA